MQDPFILMTLFNLLVVWPFARILRRAGLTPWWALVIFVPLFGMAIVLGVLAHSRWPMLPVRVKPTVKARRSAG